MALIIFVAALSFACGVMAGWSARSLRQTLKDSDA